MPSTTPTEDGHLLLPQEIVADQFMPTARIMIARELASQGCSQREIATKLGITQAAVSKYLSNQTLTTPRFVENERMQDVTKRIADEWLDEELDAYDVLAQLLDLVKEFEDRGPVCAIHEESMPALEGLGCDLCVRGTNDAMSIERDVLRDVRTAARRFASLSEIPQHIPNVGTNIAAVLPDPENVADVAAIPGRLHAMSNRIVVPSEPEFGASKHVAQALLVANQIDSSVRGTVNIATSPELLTAAHHLGLEPVEFDASYENRADELHLQFGESVPILAYHDGAYGIEPITYVFGTSATDVIHRVADLLEAANAIDNST